MLRNAYWFLKRFFTGEGSRGWQAVSEWLRVS
jgi:hypothetical protein